MIKFVKKEHYKKENHRGKIVITYSVSEVIIGFLLIFLVAFYIYHYLNFNLNKPQPVPLHNPNQSGMPKNQSTMPK